MNNDTVKFVEFPKMPRFSRECIITEKIDGTNACVFIEDDPSTVTMRFGSRNRWLSMTDDNFGFARWGSEHAEELLKLGPGRHFGEWWGSGIQRGYGLAKGEKRFSLFNVSRWVKKTNDSIPPLAEKQEYCPDCCYTVPILQTGSFDAAYGFALRALDNLKTYGSMAAPGFMNPEGIVIFHVGGNFGMKKTIEKDELPKSLAK